MIDSLHISLTPVKDCKNLDAYGTICVRCNDCGRLDKKCCICGEILKPGDQFINIEFWNVFCDYACKKHKDLFKEMTYHWQKYIVNSYKEDFLNNLKSNNYGHRNR